MKNKMAIFGIREGWPWWLLVAIFVGLSVKAFVYSYIQTDNGMSLPAIIVTTSATAAAIWITVFRYVYRWAWIDRWNNAYHIGLGMAIIPEDDPAKLRVQISGGDLLYMAIERSIIDTISFWIEWAKKEPLRLNHAEAARRIENGFKYATLMITADLIHLHGPLPSNYPKLLLGVQLNRMLLVAFDGVKIKDVQTFINVVKHEASHLCLQELGVSASAAGDNHHKLFQEVGLGV